jgi:hypothetical protein
MLDRSFPIYLLKLAHGNCNWNAGVMLVENLLPEFDYFIWVFPSTYVVRSCRILTFSFR